MNTPNLETRFTPTLSKFVSSLEPDMEPNEEGPRPSDGQGMFSPVLATESEFGKWQVLCMHAMSNRRTWSDLLLPCLGAAQRAAHVRHACFRFCLCVSE